MDPRQADPIERLIHELKKLPGIGRKTATRMAYMLLGKQADLAQSLAEALTYAKQHVHECRLCGNLSARNPCPICEDPRRSAQVICVTENVSDLLAIESSGEFSGTYHVLGGALSPLNGIGPAELRIPVLVERLQQGETKELILATSSTVDGDTTALYLAKIAAPFKVKVTRIASGIPSGSDLEYLDRVTIGRALSGRAELSS